MWELFLHKLKEQKIIVATAGLVLLLILLVSAVTKNIKKERQPEKPGTPKQQIFTSFPKVSIANWVDKSSPLQIIPQYNVYAFKRFTQQEAQVFASKFMTNPVVSQTADLTFAYNIDEVNQKASTLIFNHETGAFTYNSTEGIPIPASTSNLLARLIPDPTIRFYASYRDSRIPGMTIHEFHRNLDIPILNPEGLLNTDETRSLNSLSVGDVKQNCVFDPNIYQTSDNSDRCTRALEFNSLQILVSDKTNSVVSVTSNLRMIDLTKLEISPLLSYAQALSKLRLGEHSSLLTIPSGRGTINLAKVYPDNKTSADLAEIIESRVIIPENLPGQAQSGLFPHLLLRGKVMSDNGYLLNLIATVPLTKDTQEKVFGTSTYRAQYNPSQQQSTFEAEEPTVTPPPTPTITPTPIVLNSPTPTAVFPTSFPTTTPLPTVTFTSPTPIPVCIPEEDELDPVYRLEGYTVGFFDNPRYLGARYVDRGFYLMNPPINAGQLQFNWDPWRETVDRTNKETKQFIALVERLQKKISNMGLGFNPAYGWRRDISVLRDARESLPCPVRITGYSPTMFVYGVPDQRLNIKAVTPLTYTDPGLGNLQSWNVTLKKDELLINGVERDFIFYEYNPLIKFDTPRNGWIVQKSDLNKLASQIAGQLGLNTQETERLKFEFRSAAFDKEGRLFVGYVSQSEVDQKLPLQVTPMTPTTRIHFVIRNAESRKSVTAPRLKPIQRSDSMIFELGAALAE